MTEAPVTVTTNRTVRPSMANIRSRKSKSHTPPPASNVRTTRYTSGNSKAAPTANAGTQIIAGGTLFPPANDLKPAAVTEATLTG